VWTRVVHRGQREGYTNRPRVSRTAADGRSPHSRSAHHRIERRRYWVRDRSLSGIASFGWLGLPDKLLADGSPASPMPHRSYASNARPPATAGPPTPSSTPSPGARARLLPHTHSPPSSAATGRSRTASILSETSPSTRIARASGLEGHRAHSRRCATWPSPSSDSPASTRSSADCAVAAWTLPYLVGRLAPNARHS